MIKIKNITDEEHKTELKEMIHGYYKEILGEDWTQKFLLKAFRAIFDDASSFTEADIKKLYGEKEISDRIALGLYNDDENLVGFTSVAIFSDNVGGIYQIYIKPEYQEQFVADFKGSMDATLSLSKSLDDYFKERGANEIIMEAPHTTRFLLYLAQDMGFIKKKEHYDAIELSKHI